MGNFKYYEKGYIMKTKSIPTATVAISAFNEEHNIGEFLRSVLKQKEAGFKIIHIWIFNDGSTDKTVNVVKSFKDKRIKVFDDHKRIGKSSRLNELYKRLTTDILVQSDADIVMAHDHVIHDLIQPLLKQKEVGMCGGDPRPLLGKTFTEKAVNHTVEAYIPLRTELRGGNNIFSVDGRLLAYKKELVKKIHIPETMTSNDKFTYFSCLTLNYKYRNVPTATVWYRSPKTLKDQLRQNGRFVCSPIRHKRYFPPELVDGEIYIPKEIIVKNLIKQFIQNPVMCMYIFSINLYCKTRAKSFDKKITARWPIAFTTKNLQ